MENQNLIKSLFNIGNLNDPKYNFNFTDDTDTFNNLLCIIDDHKKQIYQLILEKFNANENDNLETVLLNNIDLKQENTITFSNIVFDLNKLFLYCYLNSDVDVKHDENDINEILKKLN